MTQHKYQMSRASYYTPKHDLGVSGINSDYLKVLTTIDNPSHGQLQKFLRSLFDIFSDGENVDHDISSDENTIVKQNLGSNDNETRSLQDLENCANAAREIGICGQHKRINRTDEV